MSVTPTLQDAIATIQAGTAFIEGGVDYRGSESVGGHEGLRFADGVFHYEAEEFHALGSYRDHERKEHEVFDSVEALIVFIEGRPGLADTLRLWRSRR